MKPNIIILDDSKISIILFRAVKKKLGDRANIFVTDSVMEAWGEWCRLYINGIVPKGIITDWNLDEGMNVHSASWLIAECRKMDPCDDSTFYVYTSSTEDVNIAVKAVDKLDMTPMEIVLDMMNSDSFKEQISAQDK